MFWPVFVGLFKLVLAGAIVLYAWLVLMALRTEGAHYQVRFNWAAAASSAVHFWVWDGCPSRHDRLLRAKGGSGCPRGHLR